MRQKEQESGRFYARKAIQSPREKEISMESDLELLQQYRYIEKAIEYIRANARRQPELDEIAFAVGLSGYHLQRLFTRWAGISPKRFVQFLTKEHAKSLLARSENLLETAHQVGLSSLGRLHELFIVTEAVTPGEFKSRGAGLTIRYGLHPSPFGKCLIATTERGVCHLSFVQNGEGEALDILAADWSQAQMSEDYQITAPLVERIFAISLDASQPIRLHLRGTNFQLKVWEALLKIPLGTAATYQQIAEWVGSPNAARAAATAVGQNPIAALIPCHRVIRKNGDFGNYRYGAARKMALLAKESVIVSGFQE
jgi:AraC family transcriptional regulator of adaptative response/methylated-DNA-[protein]-cysteine methyltransferase